MLPPSGVSIRSRRGGIKLPRRLCSYMPALLLPMSFDQERQMPAQCERESAQMFQVLVAREGPAARIIDEACLAQFRFQPFKKCFRVKCLTILVPGEFKPSSPRRMFCSMKCFEEHWRQKLSWYLEKTSTQCSWQIALAKSDLKVRAI